jgi:hypothetical protein
MTAVGIAAQGCGASPEGREIVGSASGALATGAIDLVAFGSISGLIPDLSSETAAPLENGTPGNLLGGLGSGIAWAGGNTFIAVPDRGPNAVPFDSNIDDTTSYINRLETFTLALAPSDPGSALPLTLTPTLTRTTLLSTKDDLTYGAGDATVGSGVPALNTKNTHYLTGRSDGFDPSLPSTNTGDARFDPESIRVSADGGRVYISDEYGPFVYEFQRANGKRRRSFALPPEFAITHLSSQGAVEIANNTVGRITNKGMEGLAISPDGTTLFGAMQSPLEQDGGTSAANTRIVTIDIATGAVHQYAYGLTAIKNKFNTISDILAINSHELLVDERDSKGLGDDSVTTSKNLFKIDLAGATEIPANTSGEANLKPFVVAKTVFLDIVATLNKHGIASQDIPAKLEGTAFGPDVTIDGKVAHTLIVTNDNDFIGHVVDTHHPAPGVDNPNKFFVFGIDPAALPTFVPQTIAVDPSDD